MDYKPLTERMVAKIRGWTTRSLSFAGSLQLIKSIMNSIHCYWLNHTMLPKAIVNRIEQLMRNFLWKGQEMGKGVAKVAWKDVVKPYAEGGLGLHSLTDWNKAVMAKHLWKLLKPGPKSDVKQSQGGIDSHKRGGMQRKMTLITKCK